MTIIAAKFKTAFRAGVLALAFGGGALAVSPAQAQQAPAFNFNLEIPGGQGEQDGLTFGFGDNDGFTGQQQPRDHGGYDYDDDYDRCLTDREVRRGIENYGFGRVEVRRSLGRDRVEVVGRYGNWVYSMRVDKCTGEVDRVERIRRVRNGGFGLQFN